MIPRLWVRTPSGLHVLSLSKALYTQKKNLFKMNRFLFPGTLTRFLFNLQGFSSKFVNWMSGQRSNENLILVRNVEEGFLCLFVVVLTCKWNLILSISLKNWSLCCICWGPWHHLTRAQAHNLYVSLTCCLCQSLSPLSFNIVVCACQKQK